MMQPLTVWCVVTFCGLLTAAVSRTAAENVLSCMTFEEFPDDEDITVKPTSEKLKNCCGLKQNVHYYPGTKAGLLTLDCGDDLITDVDITARNCEKKCTGLTLDLYAASRYCWWKTKCEVMYTAGVIMIGKGCYYQPTYLEVSYSCLKKETPIVDVMNLVQTVQAAEGTIRSHGGSNPSLKEHITYTVKVLPPDDVRDRAKVTVSVTKAKVSSGDLVTLGSDNQECKISENSTGASKTFNAPFIKVSYKHRKNSTNTTDFNITFKWSRIDGEDACRNSSFKSCGEGKVIDVISDLTSKHYYGVIRSHSQYPADYRKPAAPSLHGENYSTFEKQIESPRKGETCFNLKLLHFSLDYKDSLKIVDANNKNEYETKGKLAGRDISYTTNARSVNVTFKLHHARPGSASGFLMFYRWTDTCNGTLDFFSPAPCQTTKPGQTDIKKAYQTSKPGKSDRKKKGTDKCNGTLNFFSPAPCQTKKPGQTDIKKGNKKPTKPKGNKKPKQP
ncbi:uncharacterized protein LOC131928944 isoform X2 [Physella acuta]|uniref:uncharacterized protein LOC131928944 isoform X2 n=1 Tax=Physella acuta TaxID=109671 RepID=UPI0027DD0EE4|nr:uncharacterized protein LOC131928944 isoform X2 [Physella acuta]